MTPEWQAWRRSATLTRARLARIIHNTGRFDDVTWERLLDRIDAAIARDNDLLNAALELEK